MIITNDPRLSTLWPVIQSSSVEKSYAHGEERYERCGFLLGRIGKLASRRFAKALESTGLKPPHAGVLLTRVQYVKTTASKKFVICDAGMHTLILKGDRVPLELTDMDHVAVNDWSAMPTESR